MGCAVYKISNHKKHLKHSHARLYAHLLTPLLFSLELSHTKLHISMNISHIKFLWYVWIKPYFPSWKNVENSASSFRQFVQICCRKEQKEENNDNSKAFCVRRKHQNCRSFEWHNFCYKCYILNDFLNSRKQWVVLNGQNSLLVWVLVPYFIWSILTDQQIIQTLI